MSVVVERTIRARRREPTCGYPLTWHCQVKRTAGVFDVLIGRHGPQEEAPRPISLV